MKILDFSSEIVNDLNKKGVAQALDPTLLLVIQEVIQILLDMAMNYCKKTPTDVKAIVSRPGWMERFLIKRVVVKHVLDPALAIKINDSILDKGRNLSQQDVNEICSEFQS